MGLKAPPSPLGFKLALVVPWRIGLVEFYRCLGLGIVGYLIPVCVLAFVGSVNIKSLSWMSFRFRERITTLCTFGFSISFYPNHSLRRGYQLEPSV